VGGDLRRQPRHRSELVVADEKVALIRKTRQQQQEAMQKAAMIQAGADTAKNLSQADTGGKNALSDMMRGMQQ